MPTNPLPNYSDIETEIFGYRFEGWSTRGSTRCCMSYRVGADEPGAGVLAPCTCRGASSACIMPRWDSMWKEASCCRANICCRQGQGEGAVLQLLLLC